MAEFELAIYIAIGIIQIIGAIGIVLGALGRNILIVLTTYFAFVSVALIFFDPIYGLSEAIAVMVE